MTSRSLCVRLLVLLISASGTTRSLAPGRAGGRPEDAGPARIRSDAVGDLKDLLFAWAGSSGNPFLRRHALSMLAVIESKSPLTARDSVFLGEAHAALAEPSTPWSPAEWSSYVQRKRPLILA